MFVTTYSFEALTTTRIGPDFMPKIISVFMAVFSILIVFSGFKRLKESKKEEIMIENSDKVNYIPVLITLGLMIGYIVLMPIIGFLIMTALYIFCQIMVLCHKSNRKIWLFLLISIVSSVVIYYVFRSVFYVMLPNGIIG